MVMMQYESFWIFLFWILVLVVFAVGLSLMALHILEMFDRWVDETTEILHSRWQITELEPVITNTTANNTTAATPTPTLCETKTNENQTSHNYKSDVSQ